MTPSTSILTSPIVAEPAGAPSPTLGARLRGAGRAIWDALEASGRDRALRELRMLNDQWQIDSPEIARSLRDGQDFLRAQADLRKR